VHPDDRPQTVDWIGSVLATKTASSLDNRIVRPDGEVRSVQSRADTALDASGGVVRVFGTVQDITERKRREDELHLFRSLLDQSTDAILVADPTTGRIIDASGSACLSLGYTREEMLALRVPDIEATFRSVDEFEDNLRQLKAAGAFRFEGRQRRKNGSTFPVEVSVRYVARPEGDCVLTIARDVTDRLQAEEALRQTEERYRGLVESAFDGTVLHQDGVVVEVNDAYARMFGYTAEALIGTPVLNLAPPDVRETVGDLLQHGNHVRYELVGLRKDGTRFATETSSQACMYRGRPARIAAVRDVTERKQAAEAEARLVSILEATPDMVSIADPAGRLLYLNRAGRKMIGLDGLADTTSHNLREFHDAANTQIVLTEAVPTAVREGAWSGETVLTSLDGRAIPVSQVILAHKGPDGALAFLSTVARDITERNQARDTLQRSEQLLAQSQRMAHLGSWMLVLETGTLTWSDELCRMYGVSPDGFVPTVDTFLALIHADDQPAMRSWIDSVLSDKKPGPLEFRLIRPDGAVRLIEGDGEVITNAENKPVRLIGTAQDITERKRVEAELHQAKDAAEAANRAKSEFLATMSHEIRTPMNGVIGAVSLLLDDELMPRQRELASIARSSAHSLLTLINDILDISKIEAGKMPIEQAPFDLLTTLDEVGGMFAERAEEKGVDLVLRYAPDARRRFVGDAGRIRQVLLNLVGNAIKFSERGHVFVSVEEERSAERQPLALLRFAIEDTGIGISPETVNRLFGRFVQADASTTRRFGGTGLGLAICKRLVELMGGQIGVTSRVGEGSTFWFTLPLLMDASPAAAPAPTAADMTAARARLAGDNTAARHPADAAIASPGRPRFHGRVLVADDNTTNQRVAQLALEGLGCHVELARNGAEALAMLQQRPYDLVLMDCEMPEVDGFEATREIRTLEASLPRGGSPAPCRRIPVVAMTAKALSGDREKCLAAGMDAYLSKPVQLDTLLDVLERWLPLDARPGAGEPSTQTTPQAERPGVPRAVTPSGALDWAALDRLRTLAQQTTPTLFARVLDAFRTDAAKYLGVLEDAAARNDRVSLQRTAHALKGASLNVGATTMAEVSRRIETMEEAGGLADIAPLLAQLESEFQRVKAEIESELDQEQAVEHTHR
jgi:PAS domain S-box-containing protein